MSVLTVILTVVVIALGIALLVMYLNQPVKRFGLAQAEAAMRYITKKEQAKTAMGVVIGVLGYENAVKTDVTDATAELTRKNASRGEEIASNEDTITNLYRRIAGLKLNQEAAATHMAELAKIAEIFSD